MKISELIKHLENIKETDGDLNIYDNRYRTAVSISNISAFVVAYLIEPKTKREVRKFWSNYGDREEDKSEKVLRVY